MTFKEALKLYFQKAFVFKGRARRKEYWVPLLFLLCLTIVIGLATGIIALMMNYSENQTNEFINVAALVLFIVFFIPTLSLLFRRLQDLNINGMYALIPATVNVFTILFSYVTYSGGVVISLLLSIIGFFVNVACLVLIILRGTRGDNNYGIDPKRKY